MKRGLWDCDRTRKREEKGLKFGSREGNGLGKRGFRS